MIEAVRSAWQRFLQLGSTFGSEAAAFKYCLVAIVLFGVQAVIATAGALELAFQDLPFPIPFSVGRSIHLNLSVFWPLIAMIGCSYYFLGNEAGVPLRFPRLATFQFWLMAITLLGMLLSLLMGYTQGREYLEATLPFDVLLTVGLLMFTLNVWFTVFSRGALRSRLPVISITVGAVSLTLFFIPNVFYYKSVTLDEFFKFWVVHAWEELSLEVMGAGVISAMILRMMKGIDRSWVEAWLAVDLLLVIATGLLATGHHYFWIGTPNVWLWVGGIFSAAQVVPMLMMIATLYRSARYPLAVSSDRLALGFILASGFYHFTGAGLLGLAITFPQTNVYAHGTFLTSAHAHLALFGAIGMLALGCSYYVVSQLGAPTAQGIAWGWRGFWLINLGLLTMGAALALAGSLETYQLRVLGLPFRQVILGLKPYMIMRAAGGAVFALGALLFVRHVVRLLQ